MSGNDDEVKPPRPPIQRKEYDLASHPKGNKNKPPLSKHNSDYRSPAGMMHQMGFVQDKHMTPLQFLTAVFNDDLEMVFKNKKQLDKYKSKGGLGMSHRIEAAKTAAKYIHMMMPNVQITKNEDGAFANQLAKAVTEGNERVRTKTMIIETVERISPDMPLTDASYPPAFADIEGRVVEEENSDVGNTEYNPDVDD